MRKGSGRCARGWGGSEGVAFAWDFARPLGFPPVAFAWVHGRICCLAVVLSGVYTLYILIALYCVVISIFICIW